MDKTDELKISKDELAELVKDIRQVAQKNDWVFSWDKNDDALFYSPAIVPDDVQLYQVNDEFSVYLDPQKKLQGVMSEYFGHNFVEHHKTFKPLLKRVFNANRKAEEVDPQKQDDEHVRLFKDLFESTLISEACGADLHS